MSMKHFAGPAMIQIYFGSKFLFFLIPLFEDFRMLCMLCVPVLEEFI